MRSQGAVGSILECPKCGGMVQVIPPEGWQPETSPADLPADSDASPAEGVEQNTEVGAESPGPPSLAVSPAELAWRKWLLLGGVPAAAVVVAIGVCSVFFWRDRPRPRPNATAQQPAEPGAGTQPAPPEDPPGPLPSQFDPRWVPDGTVLLVSLRPSVLAGDPSWERVVEQFDGQWRQTAGAVLSGLRLKPEAIRRLDWASTDLSAWPQQSVVLIELEPGHDAASLGAISEAVDLELAGVRCRRLTDAAWKHPLAVIDSRTVVTGQAELLRQLAGRSEIHLESATLDRLLPLAASDAELTLLVDLAAARSANWDLPTAVLDVWPPGKQPWHVLWEMSEGLGCRLQRSDRFRSELVLICEGETAAEQVHAAVDELIPAAGKWLAARVETLSASPPAGPATERPAAGYELLLSEGLAAAEAARWKVADAAVWVWADWGRGPSELAAALIDSRPALSAGWLAAAREADEANHGRLLAGLESYGQSEGGFPAAAYGGARLSTEQRLSWIAAMLPYYGYEDWHRRLDPAQAWNGPQNRRIAERPLPEVVNPALGPGRIEGDFPVTHYVGVAGVGPDAGRLKADDPRAGVFGYGRGTRPEEISDGSANTIALLGVTKRLGAWAAGGEPTVRALTKPPYVDGPDGFGSGQPDGMLAGMADGSIRFISKDVDPRVLEQLATIGGGRRAAAVAGDPNAGPPQPGPDEPELGPIEPGKDPAAPIKVDVEARLADTIPDIQLRDVPLAEAVNLLAGLSTVPMTFDPEAMRQLDVTLHDPVTVQASGATVGQVLRKVASSRGLAAVVENGQILLTSPPNSREGLVRTPYTVSDLTGRRPAAAADLAALVRKLVAPGSWRPNGGRGTVKPEGDALAVVQTRLVHHQIVTFCEKLRKARGKPLRSSFSPERFALDTRLDRAKATLGRPVTANFHEPTPLIEVLSHLGRLTETDVLVDRLALGAAGVSERAGASLTADKQPLGEALEKLLRPLGLQYRVIDATTLQVTSRKAVSARLELEFYPVRQLLTGGRTGPALVEQIKGRLAGPTWSDAGGPGALHFDQPSNCLIVLQSQPVQVALQRLLAELRN